MASYTNITNIDILEQSPMSTTGNSCLVQIDESHYLIAYANAWTSSGQLKVIEVDLTDYILTQLGRVSAIAFSTNIVSSLSLIHLTNSYYILVYLDYGSAEAHLNYIYVNPSTYALYIFDTLPIVYDSTNETYAAESHLVKIDSTHFFLAFSGVPDDPTYTANGWIMTFLVSHSNMSKIDEQKYRDYKDTSPYYGVYTCGAVKLGTYTYAVTWKRNYYYASSSDGTLMSQIITLNSSNYVTSTGTQTTISTDTDSTYILADSLRITDTNFIIAYTKDSNALSVKSLSVSRSTISSEDDTTINISGGWFPSLIALSDGYVMIHYKDNSSYSAVRVFQVDSSMEFANIGTANASRAYCSNAKTELVLINDQNYIVAYTGTSSDGYVRTIDSDGLESSWNQQIYVSGWKEVIGMQIYQDGSWKEVIDMQLHQGGSWKET